MVGEVHKFSFGYPEFVMSNGDVKLYIQMQDSYESQQELEVTNTQNNELY